MVTGYILEAVRKWLRSLTKLKILKEECLEADLEKLDLKEPAFSIFACAKGAMEVVDDQNHNQVTEKDAKPELTREEHMRRIKEASNKFLNVSGKLQRVCPLKIHFGYALYDCGAVCDYSGETGLLSKSQKHSKNIVFSAVYCTRPLDVIAN